jgi:hypothetical protein
MSTSPAALVQHQFIEIDLGLQHFLRRHDVDPPGELLGLHRWLGSAPFRTKAAILALKERFMIEAPVAAKAAAVARNLVIGRIPLAICLDSFVFIDISFNHICYPKTRGVDRETCDISLRR